MADPGRTLKQGDHVKAFEVIDLDGVRVRYADLWQRKDLILVTLPGDSAEARAYATHLADALRDANPRETAFVVTAGHGPGAGRPGLLVADRWGEIQFAAESPSVEGLPDPADVAEWVQFVQMRCPECEGEAR